MAYDVWNIYLELSWEKSSKVYLFVFHDISFCLRVEAVKMQWSIKSHCAHVTLCILRCIKEKILLIQYSQKKREKQKIYSVSANTTPANVIFKYFYNEPATTAKIIKTWSDIMTAIYFYRKQNPLRFR